MDSFQATDCIGTDNHTQLPRKKGKNSKDRQSGPTEKKCRNLEH